MILMIEWESSLLLLLNQKQKFVWIYIAISMKVFVHK